MSCFYAWIAKTLVGYVQKRDRPTFSTFGLTLRRFLRAARFSAVMTKR
jgi:hypothetical protein